jgi:hypothetical protein
MSLELRGAQRKSASSAKAQRAAVYARLDLRALPAPLAAGREQQASVQREAQRWWLRELQFSEPPEPQVRPVPLAALALPQRARAPSRARPETACPRIRRPLR